MANGKIRISKPPEERRQDIIDAAMHVFNEKGYEQTTMRDIAEAVGVVPGLCYRYFESKQELFDSAMRQYVTEYCTPVIQVLKECKEDAKELFDCLTRLFIKRAGTEKYHTFFHKKENKNFHMILDYLMCDYLFSYVKDCFDYLNKIGETNIKDTASFSEFALYGSIPIINNEELSPAEKAEIMKEYMVKLMK